VTTLTFTLTRIKQIFPDFNVKAVTEFDFWRAAKKEKIVVRSMPLLVDGYYQKKNGKHYILISSYLKEAKWLHTALHEFFHYLFHVPATEGEALYRRACGDPQDPRERLADAFALVCIMPLPELQELQKEDLSDSPWLSQLVAYRFAVLSDFGL
jgi:Zn-dependent peptidase ImmA (M78 family)